MKKCIFQANEQCCFRKTKEDLRKHKNINLVTTEARRNYLALEPSYCF